MKCRLARVAREDAVEHERVEVHVQVQRATEALNHHDGAAAAVLDASVAGPITQDATHAANQDARNGPAEIVIPRQTVPQSVREAQHPLPDRHIRKHAIDQMSGAFRHAAATTARAERTAFARERHEPIESAAGAAEAREATGQPSASKEITECLLDELRKAFALTEAARVRSEGLEVIADDLVQDRICR
jgi:hypothetical protein